MFWTHTICPEFETAETQGGSVMGRSDWRDNIDVPRPREWDKRLDLIGTTVIPHTCHARVHGDNEGCLCGVIGKPVTITKLYESQLVGTPSYHIQGSSKTIQEREFSDETRGVPVDTVEGFIIEGPKGTFLSAGFNWIKAKKAIAGYLHNKGVVRYLLTAEFRGGKRPIMAYPASSKYDGSEKKITGDAVPFDELKL